MAGLSQTLKETAARIGEASALRWKDINITMKIIKSTSPRRYLTESHQDK